jgi:predicted nuclease of restriction endonuclease-like (RecB) superfamily
MAKRKAGAAALVRVAEPLYREIRAVLESARAGAYRAVNSAMVQAYWNVGRLIVEHEQGGRKRASYGLAVLDDLSQRLTEDFGKGFTTTNLKYMRSFYQAFPIRHALRDESLRGKTVNAPRTESSDSEKQNAARSKLAIRHALRDESPGLRPELSWTHYRLLLSVDDAQAREWYMHEAAEQNWSTRQLERQISVLYYERLLVSRRKTPVRKEAAAKLAAVEPEQFIRDPYVLEFLDLKDYPGLRESAVEQAIIDNLQAFLLELGKGFSFVARQKRVRFEDEDFYVDLVFYNYLLKCFVLIDLKVGKLTHQDIGQMESYVRMFDAHARPEGDNPTIGLILCSRKNEAIAKYSVLSEARQIFAAKYVKILPTERELTREIERERRLIDARRAEKEKR